MQEATLTTVPALQGYNKDGPKFESYGNLHVTSTDDPKIIKILCDYYSMYHGIPSSTPDIASEGFVSRDSLEGFIITLNGIDFPVVRKPGFLIQKRPDALASHASFISDLSCIQPIQPSEFVDLYKQMLKEYSK